MISPTHGLTRLPNLALMEDNGVLNSLGFIAQAFQADTSQTLLIGDFVYLSDFARVSKSGTVANYNARKIGVVVGGTSFNNAFSSTSQVNYDPNLVGTVAAVAGETVWVAVAGRVFAIAGGTISAIGQLIASTTSGRVATGTTATGILGYNISTGATGGPIIVQIQFA